MKRNPSFPSRFDLEDAGMSQREARQIERVLQSAIGKGSTAANRALAKVRMALDAPHLSEIEIDGEVVAVFVDVGDPYEETVIYDVYADDFVYQSPQDFIEERGSVLGGHGRAREARGSIYPSARANPGRFWWQPEWEKLFKASIRRASSVEFGEYAGTRIMKLELPGGTATVIGTGGPEFEVDYGEGHIAGSASDIRKVLARIAKTTNPPSSFTPKGERMYKHVKRSYGDDPRAKEIAARTVYARSKEGSPGLVKNPALNDELRRAAEYESRTGRRPRMSRAAEDFIASHPTTYRSMVRKAR